MTGLSESEQDYLKTIYSLCEQHARATTSQIAESLNLKPASITSMVQKLSKKEPALVSYKKHYGVTLTKSGHQMALSVIRHHRIVETFLCEKLGYTWDEVHEEAERLEHAISPKMLEKMADALGQPERDPHGHRIPTTSLNIAPVVSVPISQLKSEQKAIIRRIQSDDPMFLKYLDNLGLRPNVVIKITNVQSLDQVHHIRVEGGETAVPIGHTVATKLFVEPLPVAR
ncbi:MAG: metal-dependent transcriptional regulator [Chloroflexi bacterium]|nr:metal-dependent transcriptional regulator [Chloroflexota bacterium]